MFRQILPLILPIVGLAQCLGVNNGIFLSTSDFRNRLQSILYITDRRCGAEADIAGTVESNIPYTISTALFRSRNLLNLPPVIFDIPRYLRTVRYSIVKGVILCP